MRFSIKSHSFVIRSENFSFSRPEPSESAGARTLDLRIKSPLPLCDKVVAIAGKCLIRRVNSAFQAHGRQGVKAFFRSEITDHLRTED